MAQVIINVEDDENKEIVEKGIKALKPEQLQETIVSAIGDFLKANNYNILKNILFERKSNYDSTLVPSRFLDNIIRSLNYSELQVMLDKIIDELSNNYKEVLVAGMSDLLINRLTSDYHLDNLIKGIDQQEIDKYMVNKENGRI